MGYSSFHQALPESSELARLLLSDRAAVMVLAEVWSHGGYPLQIREAGSELEFILDDLAEGDPTELAAIWVVFDRLEAAIARTCQAHLGLEERTAFVEKVHDLIAAWVERRFEAAGRAGGAEFARQLLFGQTAFDVDQAFFRLDLPFVQSAARFFGEPGMLDLDDDDEDGFGDDLRSLAQLCIAAAECGEIVLSRGS